MLIEKIFREIECELNWDVFLYRHKQTICWEKAIHFDWPSANSQPLWERSNTDLTQICLLKCSPRNLLNQIESHWKRPRWKRWFNFGIRKKIVLWHYYQQCLAYKEARHIISLLNPDTLSSNNRQIINQMANFIVYRYLSFERETVQSLYYLEKNSFIYSIKIHAFKCDLYINYCRHLNYLTKNLSQEEQKEIKIFAAKSYQSLKKFFGKFYEQRLVKFPKNNHNISGKDPSSLSTSTVHTTNPIQHHLIKNKKITLTFDSDLKNETLPEKESDFYFLQKALFNVQETLNKYDPCYYLNKKDENENFNIIIFHLQKIDLLKSYLSHLRVLFNQRFCEQISEIQQILALIADPHSKKKKININNSQKLQLLSKQINQWCTKINQLPKNNTSLLHSQTEKEQQILELTSFLDKNSVRIKEKMEIIPFYKNKMQQTLTFIQKDSLYFLEKLKKRARLVFPMLFFYSFSKKQRKIKKQILFFEEFLSQLNKALENQFFIDQSFIEQAQGLICEIENDNVVESRSLLRFLHSKNYKELSFTLILSCLLLTYKLKSYKEDKYKFLIQEEQLQKLLFWQDKTKNERLLLYKIEQLKKITPLKNITEINEAQLAKGIIGLDKQRKKWDKKEAKKTNIFLRS